MTSAGIRNGLALVAVACCALCAGAVGAGPAAAASTLNDGAARGAAANASGVGHGGLTVGRALTEAAASGRPVAVSSAMTASSTLTANPDGSLTIRESLAPVRKLVGGRWVPLDATLVRAADGGVVATATTSALRLSAGGGGPLATMSVGSKTLSVWLPMRLPAPVLSGSTATYSSVLPGVDLQVTADEQGGFSEVLVVHDAAAAHDPALRQLLLRTRGSGVRLAAGPGGSVVARDGAGVAVFAAMRPLMWDSSRRTGRGTLIASPVTGRLVDARDGMAAISSAAGPGEGARSVQVALRLTGQSISLVPKASLLSSPSTVFPVYIDPTFTPPSAGSSDSAWAQVDSAWPATTYWKQSGYLQVGDQGWSSPYFVARSFARLSIPSVIKGSTILSAQLNFTEEWSPSCTKKEVDLWETGGISSSTSWNSQPGWTSKLATQTVAHGYSTSCPAAGVGFNLQSYIQGLANKSTVPSTETFGLRASSETDAYGWKQFRNTASLAITYDHTADQPSGLTTSPPTSCTASTPTTVGDGSVTLYIPVNDPDKGSNGSPQVGVKVELWNSATGTEVANFPLSPSQLYGNWGTTLPYVVSQSSLEALANGAVTEFSWQAWATDFRQVGGSYVYSSASSVCHFYFDPTRQGAPTVTESGSATIGQQASFAVTPPSSGTAPSSYRYQLNGGPVATVTASSGTATITVTPYRSTSVLSVTSVSAGGNIGDSASTVFNVAPAANAADSDLTGDGKADLLTVGSANGLPAGLWMAPGNGSGQVGTPVDMGADGNGTAGDNLPSDFNGDQAITGYFESGSGLQDVLVYSPSTGTGTILFGTGDGSPIPAQQSGWEQDLSAVTDLNGSSPQQVVNAGNASTLSEPFPDLLGISGNTLTLYSSAQSGFYLDDADTSVAGYDISATTSPDGTADWNAWTLATTQLASGTAMYLWDKSTGALYLWEDLTYNAAGADLSYAQYVIADGSSSTWNKGSSVSLSVADMTGNGVPDVWTVGSGGAATGYLATLGSGTATLAAQPAQTLMVPAHDWPLTDTTGGAVTTARDSTGSLNATGSGNATWNTSDALFSPDVALDGTSGKLSTASKALDPGSDFTVSAWAFPTAIGPMVVSQDMTQAASFKLYSDGSTGLWAFCMAQSDTSGPTYDCAKGGTVYVNEWFHLTVTYEASAKTMTLYVNGVSVATQTHTPLTGVTNADFQIGDRIQSPGSYLYFFAGQLSGVQLWSKVVTP